MKHKTKLMAFVMALVTVLVTVAFTGCVPEDLFSANTDETEVTTSDTLSVEPQSNPYLSLSASPVTVAVTENATVLTQTLTATIIPPTTVNKEVDWTVAWGNNSATGEVTDYITVTPESDGSTTATVACYQPFTGDIIITVITRDGGYTAQCICNYVGNPTSLVIEPTGATSVSDSSWGVRIAEVKSGSTYHFNLRPSNAFGYSNSSFVPEYTVSIQAFGGIDTYQENFDSSGALTGTINGTVDLTVADLMDTEGYCYAYFPKTGGLHVFMDVSIENGKLKIEAKDDPASYTWTTGSRLGKATCSFAGYTGGKLPYVLVTVTEKNTGITQTICIRTVSDVRSVALSKSRMSF